MLHSNTERLIDYWRTRKLDRLSPPRSAIDPCDITELLPQIFILGRKAPGEFRFRLSGGLISDLHQADLRAEDFGELWASRDRPRLSAAMEAARRAAEPLVITAEARSDQDVTVRIEMMVAPLRAESQPFDRCLGLYQPLTPLAPLRGRPVIELGLIRFASSDHREAVPQLRLAAIDGQRIA
jgi:hypothetical protein